MNKKNAKNELGRISKVNTRQKTPKCFEYNQSQSIKSSVDVNSNVVISWFKVTKNKQNSKFISFDTKDFYPISIKELLLSKCVSVAETKIQITEDDKQIIYHLRKLLLFDKGNKWMKKGNLFDVAMGAYNGAEECELVGTFLLEKISEICNKSSIGLYRDNGLTIFRSKSGSRSEKINKEIERII